MLFSRDDVAAFVNQNFEAVWETVRPVPIIRIDFGNGTVLTRTLHGNIATHVCTAEGQALDIMAGIYNPSGYLRRLDQFRLLANYVDQEGKEKRETRLRDYHRSQAEALKVNETPAQFVNMPALTKGAIERNLKAMLVPGNLARQMTDAKRTRDTGKEDPKLDSTEDLANWKLLAEDTQVNETVRRRQIDEMLAAKGTVRPEAVTKWLYKDVLHADLDDPYLGLGETLFASYPFKDDKSR